MLGLVREGPGGIDAFLGGGASLVDGRGRAGRMRDAGEVVGDALFGLRHRLGVGGGVGLVLAILGAGEVGGLFGG